MKAQKLVAYGAALEARELPDLHPQGPGVVVRLSHCGVCHSDLHLRDGFFSLGPDRRLDIRESRNLPFTLGHEMVGTVVALGPEAEGVAVGDRRIVYPWIGCGRCATCARGLEHLCPRGHHLGITVDGGYGEQVLVPHARYLVPFDGIAADHAGPLACSGITAYSALQKIAPAGTGDPVLIIGAGGVGLMAVQIATALFGAAPLVAEIDPAKGAAALAAGAAEILDPRDKASLVRVTRELGGAHAALDFVGSEQSAGFGLAALRRGGTLVMVGLYGGALILPLPNLPLRSIALTGSYVGSLADLKALVALIQRGQVAPVPVTLRPLGEANEALADLAAGRAVGRIVLTM